MYFFRFLMYFLVGLFRNNVVILRTRTMNKTSFMKRLLPTSILALLFVMPMLAQEPQVGIAKWKGDKRAAVCLTFDDGLAEHYTIVAPELEKRGFRGTFGVCGALINEDNDHIKRTDRMTWPQLREMAQRGHEISNHGWQHRNHGRFPLDTIRYDIQHNDTMIMRHTGVMPTTFFYPNNTKRPEPMALAEQGRVGTRTFQISMGSKRTQLWMKTWIDDLVDSCGGMATMTHGITYGYDAFKDAKRLTGFLDLLKRREGQLWVCRLHDFLAYIKERNSTTLTVESKGKRLLVTPHTLLDSAIFHYPLTMRIVMNDTKHSLRAEQDGRELTVRMKNDTVAVFDFNPNGGAIEVTKAKRKTIVDMSDAGLQKDRLHFTAKSAERLGNAMYELIK